MTKVEARITSRTRGILPVHLYGQAADMEPIMTLAAKYGLTVIEDNAQAIGATYGGKRTGGLGVAGCLSFFPSKNLGAYGDGGMVVTDSEEIADRVRRLRVHGVRTKYYSQEQGYNSRLDELQAAVLRVKLRHLDAWNTARRKNAATYSALLNSQFAIPVCRLGTGRRNSQFGITPPQEATYGKHVYHQYTIRTPHRDAVQRYLRERGIATMIYYPAPIHLQPLFAACGYQAGDFPEAERAAKEVLSIPMFPELTDEQMTRVAGVLGEAMRKLGMGNTACKAI